MGILEDQNKVRQQNLDFLVNYAKKLFNDLFDRHKTNIETLITKNVFDTSDIKEVKIELKTIFKNVDINIYWGSSPPYKFFESVKIENNKFIYDVDEIIKPAINSQLINPYELIENKFSRGHDFNQWVGNIVYTTKKVYLKYLLEQLKPSSVKYNQTYLYLFKPWGFELFEFLNDRFEGAPAETVKYTILFHFLKSQGFVSGLNARYLEFVKSNYSKRNFNRLDFDDVCNEKLKRNEQRLNDIYREFLQTHDL
ncbi:hypothetical protein [Algibacter pacificus]|uniref:hypothetical protein n=1 Tax=Algibacter pacificus TaxID=2599389 RepID=UPI0011C7767A|nr:hypothetical protein [Algibacter pacificus]